MLCIVLFSYPLPRFKQVKIYQYHNTHTHPFNGPLSRTTRVKLYLKGKTNLDFTEARDSEWQWHQLGHMQVCTSIQTDNHASTPPLCFLQAGCPSCRPTNSVKALKAYQYHKTTNKKPVIKFSTSTVGQSVCLSRVLMCMCLFIGRYLWSTWLWQVLSYSLSAQHGHSFELLDRTDRHQTDAYYWRVCLYI